MSSLSFESALTRTVGLVAVLAHVVVLVASLPLWGCGSPPLPPTVTEAAILICSESRPMFVSVVRGSHGDCWLGDAWAIDPLSKRMRHVSGPLEAGCTSLRAYYIPSDDATCRKAVGEYVQEHHTRIGALQSRWLDYPVGAPTKPVALTPGAASDGVGTSNTQITGEGDAKQASPTINVQINQ